MSTQPNVVHRTQRVSAVDLRAGRIRMPIGQKGPLPPSTTRLDVDLIGDLVRDVASDSRFAPDRERSGVLYLGRAVRDRVTTDEVLEVTEADGGIVVRRPV